MDNGENEPRRRVKVTGFSSENFDGCLMERSDGTITVMVQPKGGHKKGQCYSVVRVEDASGANLMFNPFPVGECMKVTWRSHEPFEVVIPQSSISDETKE